MSWCSGCDCCVEYITLYFLFQQDSASGSDVDADDDNDKDDAAWGVRTVPAVTMKMPGPYSQLKRRARWLKEKEHGTKEGKQDFEQGHARCPLSSPTAKIHSTCGQLGAKSANWPHNGECRSEDHRSLLCEAEAMYRLSHRLVRV